MSLARRAKKRDAAEPEIVSALRKAGAVVWYQDRPFDLLVGFHGRLIALEVKGRVGKLKPAQVTALADSIAHGLPFFVVRSVDDALRALHAVPVPPCPDGTTPAGDSYPAGFSRTPP